MLSGLFGDRSSQPELWQQAVVGRAHRGPLGMLFAKALLQMAFALDLLARSQLCNQDVISNWSGRIVLEALGLIIAPWNPLQISRVHGDLVLLADFSQLEHEAVLLVEVCIRASPPQIIRLKMNWYKAQSVRQVLIMNHACVLINRDPADGNSGHLCNQNPAESIRKRWIYASHVELHHLISQLRDVEREASLEDAMIPRVVDVERSEGATEILRVRVCRPFWCQPNVGLFIFGNARCHTFRCYASPRGRSRIS
mmetsp:Transcript_16775/g.30987  ORF Transcript_16775/g.30987 Transcript_16775/m.30987 type:complete len:254 (+) Transcript_16775:379-1140(+)